MAGLAPTVVLFRRGGSGATFTASTVSTRLLSNRSIFFLMLYSSLQPSRLRRAIVRDRIFLQLQVPLQVSSPALVPDVTPRPHPPCSVAGLKNKDVLISCTPRVPWTCHWPRCALYSVFRRGLHPSQATQAETSATSRRWAVPCRSHRKGQRLVQLWSQEAWARLAANAFFR